MPYPRDAGPYAHVLKERMVTRLRLRHLRLLAALESSTTLSEAAGIVGITQPAASQALRELEEMLEITLFERHARGLRSTEAGRLMAQQSRQVLGSVGYAAEAIAACTLGMERPLRIGAIPAALSCLVRPRMDALRRALVHWRLSFHEGMPDEMAAALQSGTTQLGLLRKPALLPDHRLVFTELCTDEMIVVASPRHPAAPPAGARSERSLSDLATYPWSLPIGVSTTSEAFVHACETAGFSPRHANMQSISITLLHAITADAMTLAAVPKSIAGFWLETGDVVQVNIDQSIPLPPLGALHRADENSAAIQTVIQVLKN